jgi:hypothetical protein
MRKTPFLFLFVIVAGLLLLAQTSLAQIHGVVKDTTGGVIPGATITAVDTDNRAQTVQTDATGTYRFSKLAAGTYSITATYPGMQQISAVLLQLNTGQAAAVANISMTVQAQKQEVTVEGESTNKVSTEPANNLSALVLKAEDLDALPDDPDDLTADLEALAGPSAGPGGTQIFVDGFSGGRLPPKASIREIRINSNPFSAEYDKMGFGRIEIFTKPGSDKFHGQAYFGTSEGIWNSRNPFLTDTPPFQTQLFGGNVSGPLTSKASFFLDFDRRNIDDNGIVNATVPTTGFLTGQTLQNYYATPQRRTTISPRMDYQLSANNTLSLRYAYLLNDQKVAGIGSYNLGGLSVGDVTLGSAGYTSSSRENLFQLVDTAVLSPRIINETHFQYAQDTVTENSLSSTPGLNVANSFVSGGSGYKSSYDTQHQYELQNYTSVTQGAHVIKFGARVRADLIDDYSAKNFNGTFSFLGTSSGLTSLQQYLMTEQLLAEGLSSAQVTAMGYGPSQYSVSSGKPYIGLSQVDAGPFVQDDWKLRPNFTLSLGLRYEVQTNISDKKDWAPRLAFAWAPGFGHNKTVIRAGWGMFYDRFQVTNVLNAYRNNGENQQNYLVTDPTTYNSDFTVTPALSTLTSTSGQRYVIDSNLEAPRLMQTVVGLERQLSSKTTLSFNFVNSRGTHILRTTDINAPLPGTDVRPYGNVGDIYDYQSTGIYKQTQIMLGVNTQLFKRVTLFSRYVHGDAHSDTDGLSTFPSNPYNFSQDWGRSSLDIRHLLFVGGSISLPFGVRLSPFFIAHSGAPFNITTGTDLYDTGQMASSARPSIASGPGANIISTPYGYLDTVPTAGQTLIARNAGNAPAFIEMNLRLSKTWGFGTTHFEGASGGSTARQGGGGPGGPGGGGPPPGGGGPPPGGGGPGGPGGPGGESGSHRYNVTLSIMARDALNHENLSTPVGVITSPYFLQSTSIAGGFGPETVSSNQRRIDLQLRFTF